LIYENAVNLGADFLCVYYYAGAYDVQYFLINKATGEQNKELNEQYIKELIEQKEKTISGLRERREVLERELTELKEALNK